MLVRCTSQYHWSIEFTGNENRNPCLVSGQISKKKILIIETEYVENVQRNISAYMFAL